VASLDLSADGIGHDAAAKRAKQVLACWKGVSYIWTTLKTRGKLEPMPSAESEAYAVRRQLDRVLASAGFSRNERMARFLRFVVEHHLEGKDSELKESVIAVEVFGRRPDHDPAQDSIVRTEAGRLRARLAEYYKGEGRGDALVIELPKGGYVPVFRQAVGASEAAAGLPDRSVPRLVRWWLFTGIGCVVALVAAVGWWRVQHQNAPIPIAVLPLITLSQEPNSDYFADGLTGEIIRNLSTIDGLVVRSQTSSFVFKGKPQNVRDAGRQLNADYIVEGSVLRSGQHLRIDAELIRVRDDFPLWSGRYDRELTDIFAIQDEISQGIVNSLRLKLGRGRRRYETSVEAYDLYLRARAFGGGGQFGQPGWRQSIPFFEQAIAKDPTFAPAYAGLAVAHVILSNNFNNNIPEELTKILPAAERAVQLDPLSAEAYDALGAAYAREGQWEQSEKNFIHAIEIQPSRAESHADLAAFLLLPLGRTEEALQHLRIAERNDPLSSFVHLWLGDALADAGRNEEAARACEKMSELNANKEGCVLRIRVLQGKAMDVIHIYEADPAKSRVGAGLGCAYARAGRREEAEKVFAATRDIARAEILACLGDKDHVFEALDRDAGVGPIRMGWVLNRVNRERPGLLRGDPRLEVLRKKVGLPD
jgi:TolB-like protein/Flp pilus assembly protein TadD